MVLKALAALFGSLALVTVGVYIVKDDEPGPVTRPIHLSAPVVPALPIDGSMSSSGQRVLIPVIPAVPILPPLENKMGDWDLAPLASGGLGPIAPIHHSRRGGRGAPEVLTERVVPSDPRRGSAWGVAPIRGAVAVGVGEGPRLAEAMEENTAYATANENYAVATPAWTPPEVKRSSSPWDSPGGTHPGGRGGGGRIHGDHAPRHPSPALGQLERGGF